MTDARDHLVLPLDVPDLPTARARAEGARPLVRDREGRLRALGRRRPRRARRAPRGRLRRVRRPQAPRHPDDRRAGRATSSAAGAPSSSTSTPSAASRCSAPASPASPTAPGTAGTPQPAPSPSPCSPARPTRAPSTSAWCSPRPRAATGWCAPRPRRPRPAPSHLAPMVPGIRLAGSAANDQARVATPHDAIHAGAEWIIVGRSVTAADDPQRAAARLTAEVDAALHETSPSRRRDR